MKTTHLYELLKTLLFPVFFPIPFPLPNTFSLIPQAGSMEDIKECKYFLFVTCIVFEYFYVCAIMLITITFR